MKTTSLALALVLLLAAGTAGAQSVAGALGLIVYPSGGQTADQQRTDEQECHAWATETTGIDPEHPEALETPAVAEQTDAGGAAAQSAVRGMARGALIGNLSGNDWEDWAAAGAISGGVRGAKGAQRRNAQAQQQATQSQQAAAAEEVEHFKNAFSACIEGRSYTIK
jgi:hypothetical protein